MSGPPIIETAWAPRGTIYVIDPAAIEISPTQITWGDPVQVPDRSSFTVGMGVAFNLNTKVESDPFDWPRARSVWALWRQVKAIFGYEFRKASGGLRRVPRSIGVISGITA